MTNKRIQKTEFRIQKKDRNPKPVKKPRPKGGASSKPSVGRQNTEDRIKEQEMWSLGGS
jgi:hypothetical protein